MPALEPTSVKTPASLVYSSLTPFTVRKRSISPSPSQSPKHAPRDLPLLAACPESVNPITVGAGVGCDVGWLVGMADGCAVGNGVTDGAGVEDIVSVVTEPLVLVSQQRYHTTEPSVA